MRKRNDGVERLRKYIRNGGYGCGFDYRKGTPSIEKGHKPAIYLLEVDIFASRVGQHPGNFCITQCSKQTYDSCKYPAEQDQSWRAQTVRHRCDFFIYTRPDNAA